MKRETRYILILVITALVFVAVQLVAPKPINWNPTYDPSDKNPFGAYVVKNLMADLFPGQPLEANNLTIYELSKELGVEDNLLSMSTRTDSASG